jgi:hypothetical protein
MLLEQLQAPASGGDRDQHMCGLPAEEMDRLKQWSEMLKRFMGSAASFRENYNMAERVPAAWLDISGMLSVIDSRGRK